MLGWSVILTTLFLRKLSGCPVLSAHPLTSNRLLIKECAGPGYQTCEIPKTSQDALHVPTALYGLAYRLRMVSSKLQGV